MPALNLPADEYFMRWLTQTERRLSALETQQNWAIRDTANNVRVQGGLLPHGEYGLQVLGPDGALQRVGGWAHGYVQTSGAGQTTTSTSWTNLTTPGPQVTCTIGTSGLALITMSAYMQVKAGTFTNVLNGVYAGVRVDSTTPGTVGTPRLTLNSVSHATQGCTVSLSYMQTGLSPGSHTFGMRYKVYSGTTGLYQTRTLVVQPL